jgi:hypothetical protein
MNGSATGSALLLAVLLTGCAKPDVKYSDLRPATTAIVSNGVVTVHLGSDLTASACWTRVKSRIEGAQVYLVGYRTLREQTREISVRIPTSTQANSVKIVWVDPDGSQVSIPRTR